MDEKITEKALTLYQRWTYLVFFCFGFTYMNIIARLVGISDLLGISDHMNNASLTAFLLLFSSAGDVTGSLIGGALIGKISSKKLCLICGTSAGCSLILISLLVLSGSYYACIFGFLVFGISLGPLNIGMNMLAADIERYKKKELMLRFHSFFNLGTVAGSAFSEIIVLLKIPMIVQHIISASFIFFVMLMVKKYVFDHQISKGEEQHTEKHTTLKEKISVIDIIVILVGLIVLCSELIEGSGNNWIMKAIEEDFHIGESRLIPILWTSLMSALLTRFFGSILAQKLGKINTIYLGFVLSLIGVSIICFSPIWQTSFVGAFLWGGGISLCYPLTISIIASQKKNAAFKTSIVSAIAGVFNIAVPPIIGTIGVYIGITNALLILIPVGIIGIFLVFLLKRKL